MGVPFRIMWDYVFDNPEDMGDTDGHNRVIRIASHDGRREELASTVLHEFMHAVLYVSGLEDTIDGYRKDLDETTVRVMEHGLFPLLPMIVALTKGAKK